MRFQAHLLVAACAAKSFISTAFAPSVSFVSKASTSARYISSWTDAPTTSSSESDNVNPISNVQAYLKEPGPVEARNSLDGTVLVSGLVKTTDRTDQTLFDQLNNEESIFSFSKIVAFVDDASFAKKRLLSRSARYTGLLDKLDFVQAEAKGALPTVSQLDGVKSWVAYLDQEPNMLEKVHEIAKIAKQSSSLVNVAILLAGASELDASESLQAVEALKSCGKQYTLVAVGSLVDTPQGKEAYQFEEFGTTEGIIPSTTRFSRDESCRLISELLQLECGVNRALSFAEIYNVNATEVRLVKGLRAAGYSRPQEIDHMIRLGPKAYDEACEAFLTKNPDYAKGYTNDLWWERPEYVEARNKMRERDEEDIARVKDERTLAVEKVAKEWAKREYFRQKMAGAVEASITEEEYTKSVWERAMFEGDIRYRQVKGERFDEVEALADFKAQQERKAAVMLKRAKQEMKDILEAEDLVGEDLKPILDADAEEKKTE
ncbi:hypothetical protein MPSEU_000997900 [Mayamaea pseudoterrestris]|nr:hypothetical protein MPSEU_000997900 [Mayamaea pseudoterrestris]